MKKPIIKKILTAVLVLIVLSASYVLYQWYKPHRNVQYEEAVTITATALYKAFQANEKDPKYLDKAIQVSGTVAETSTNQAGKTVCFLNTDDPAAIINCTFTNNGFTASKSTSKYKRPLYGLYRRRFPSGNDCGMQCDKVITCFSYQ